MTAHRTALRALQAGAIVSVLASVPYKLFDLDRFFVPKELTLIVVATVAAVVCIAVVREIRLTRADELLIASVILSVLSGLLAANLWLAERSLLVVLGSVLCYWIARCLTNAGHGRALTAGLALAGVAAALTALLQAYGARTELFSLNRAPGGTLGNRNFIAHLCAITLPALILSGIRAPNRNAFVRWCIGGALVSAALILSRSRAAWLALLAGVIVLVIAGIVAFRGSDGSLRASRAVTMLAIALLGGGAALLIPNTLDWKSSNPYLDTAQGLVNYRGGSGHGRLIQYGNTLRMSLRHPVLGVGPGNWAVLYPKFASTNDPSLGQDGMTSNPWPSSDWMSILAERGPLACGLLIAALVSLFIRNLHGLVRLQDAETRVSSAVFLSTLVIVLIVGAFDAVLLLPAPALIAWSLLGVLSADGKTRRTILLGSLARVTAVLTLVAAGGLMSARSARQLLAMSLVTEGARSAAMERASIYDPGSYRIHIRLAEAYTNRGDCKRARPHIAAAKSLFPSSPAARRLAGSCGA